ncbi:MAG TPA: 50S ribosomal protein L18 [Candidatus Acidoferrales bacterium]|jgi:large subunit ribosomal protein L18|nr:50S ribosomal protein L18 [Candidatus Acidoferrales bacterium]
MFTKHDRRAARARRHRRVRKHVSGTAARPRLAVFRSLRHIGAQLVDDANGHTIVAASTTEPALRSVLGDGNACTTAGAAAIGKTISERARAAGVDTVVFDRAGYLFHGRVKALAEAAREGGLKF